MQLQGQNRSVTDLRAAEPVEEVDVDDELSQLHHIFLLLRAEKKPTAANDHLQDVQAGAHPSGVVGIAQAASHFEVGHESR